REPSQTKTHEPRVLSHRLHVGVKAERYSLHRRNVRSAIALASTSHRTSSRLHQRVWRKNTSLVRATCDDGTGHPPRKAHKEMEPRLETRANRSDQPGLARSRRGFRPGATGLILLGSRFRGNDENGGMTAFDPLRS